MMKETGASSNRTSVPLRLEKQGVSPKRIKPYTAVADTSCR